MNILLHPTIDVHEAKRIAIEQGCLLVYSGERLRLKQRRIRRGLDNYAERVRRHLLSRVNRSFAMALRGDYAESLEEIHRARRDFELLMSAGEVDR